MENRKERNETAGRTDEHDHNLYRLKDLDDYEVADHDPDIRGWEVRSKDGSSLGEVKDLVIDKDAMKARYIDVHLNDKVYTAEDDEDMHLLVPVGTAALHKDEDNVLLDLIESPAELQQKYPVCPGPVITQAYEQQLRSFYSESAQETKASKTGTKPDESPILAYDRNNDESFYNQSYFDESRLHRHRRKGNE